MSARNPHPDRDTLLLFMSALLDGELPAHDEETLFAALAEDDGLLRTFEAMQAVRSPAAALTDDEADTLGASIAAALDPTWVDAGAGATLLASQIVDGELSDAGVAHLDALLSEPAQAHAAAGFLFAAEALGQASVAVSEAPQARGALQALPDLVAARVAQLDRQGALASAYLDDAVSDAERDGVHAAWQADTSLLLDCAAWAHTGEALRVAHDGPALHAAAARAGAAALQALEAASHQQAAVRAPVAPVASSSSASFGERLRTFLQGAFVPAALAGAAALVFFNVGGEPGVDAIDDDTVALGTMSDSVARDRAKNDLVDAMAPIVLGESLTETELAAAGAEHPILDDNAADIEAIDATDRSVVFATSAHNITIIWVADDGAEGQGT